MADVERLTSSEALAMAGLIRILIRYDRTFSDAERQALGTIAGSVAVSPDGSSSDPLGEEAFYELMERAEHRFPDDAAIRDAALAVTRTEAREAIHAMLFEVAASDMITTAEGELLDWLAEKWDLEIPEDLPGEETDAG